MKNPIRVHQDYDDRHPIVWEPNFGYYDLEHLESVWDVNAWFSDMYRNFEGEGFQYEEVLDQIVYHSPVAKVRGGDHNMLYVQAQDHYQNEPMIKSKTSLMDGYRESTLGFRVVRNK